MSAALPRLEHLRIPFWACAALLLASAALFLPELNELATLWSTLRQTTPGFYLAILAPLLLWLRRDELVAGGNRWGGVAGLAITVPLWAMAKSASVLLAYWCLSPVLVGFAVWAVFGVAAARIVAWPLVYCLFAAPLVEDSTPLFQWMTSQGASFLARLVSVQATIHGDVVTIPEGSITVGEGCAGIHYLVAALATTTVFAALERLKWRTTLLLLLAGALVSMFGNWLRVAIIIYAAHVTQMHSSLLPDHDWLGWVVFAAMILPFIFVARAAVVDSPRLGPAPASGRAPFASVALSTLVGVLLVAIAPAWGWLGARTARAEPVPTLNFPRVDGWQGPSAAGSNWIPYFPGAAATGRADYASASGEVEAFVAAYTAQTVGRKLVGRLSLLAGRGPWVAGEARARTSPAGVTEIELGDGFGHRRIVWYWYEAQGDGGIGPYALKLRQALHAFGLPARAGIVALSSACSPDCGDAEATLARAYAAGLSRLSAGTARP